MFNLTTIEDFIILFILSVSSVYLTENLDINIFNLFNKNKRKQTIFYTFYLFIASKMDQIAFFFLKDYFVVTKFPQYDFTEKRRLSLIEIVKQSFPTFLILSALYLLFI